MIAEKRENIFHLKRNEKITFDEKFEKMIILQK